MNSPQSSEDFPTSRTGSSPERAKSSWPLQGNRRGLLTALGVGVVLVILVISAAVFVNQNSGDDNETKQRLVSGHGGTKAGDKVITLPDILTGAYMSRGYNGTWISDTEIQYFDAQYNVTVYDVEAKVSRVILTQQELYDKLQTIPFQVTLSPDKTYALIGHRSQKLYRHSVFAKYHVVKFGKDGQENTYHPLYAKLPDQDLLQLVEWSPTNGVAFVFANDVYYRDKPEGITLTITDTQNAAIYNGVADWVYEEEMFGTSKAMWFSPDGKFLAYATFNDTEVESIKFPIYGNPSQFPRNQYPFIENIPYPKAGTTNPTVKVSIANLQLAPVPSTSVQYTELIGPELSYYVGTVTWAKSVPPKLVLVTLNRAQNYSRTLTCATNGRCDQILQTDQENGWIDINTPLSSKTGDSFLMLRSMPGEDGSTTYYHHIAEFDLDGTVQQRTKGNFSVDSISGWDEDAQKVYFMATRFNTTTGVADPSESQLFSVSLGANSVITCLTCGLQNADGNECRSNSAQLSKSFSYFVHSCGGPSIPEVNVRSLPNVPEVRITWVDNAELKTKLEPITLPKTQDYDIPLASGYTAKARLWLPPNYEKGKKYPLLVDVYGGPGSQKLNRGFGISWGTSLTLDRNVIYASIDGRGSGRQSDNLLFELHRKLGTVEIEDQIAVAQWLIDNNTDQIIDRNRTAIWGWSYGGYATAMVMGMDKGGVYKCGISVAPVTSWVFYDTIYTERYMGLPTREDNLQGYNSSDVTNHIENFRTKKYYLIHGNADDNVHYQQSMILSRALEKADILFRQQSYPDEDHSLGNVRRHLYHSLEDFLFEECF